MSDSTSTASSAHPDVPATTRLISLDAYRGLVMLLMVSGSLGLAQVAGHFPASRAWQFLARQSDHVRWQGCSAWDLIMPAFLFIVGVALPFSVAGRLRRGQTRRRLLAHALWRSLALILLGLALSDTTPRTDVNFINVLAQIGLGYWFVVLVVGRSMRAQACVLVAILAGYWLWFFCYPLPGASFDYAAVGVPAGWHHLRGVAAHWDLNTNPGSAFDRWFLNLFPREHPFRFRAGGGSTLNFIPSIATMILGVMAGELLRSERTAREKTRYLLIGGISILVAGIALDPGILPFVESSRWTLCPIIKRIWTPSFVLYSGGWVMTAMAVLYWLVDVRGRQRWTIPLVVVGMNSLVMYLLAALATGWIRKTLRIALGSRPFDWTYGPILESICVLFILWSVCLWMFRRRIFLKI